MCGICGYITPPGQPPVDTRLLARMNTALTHRGPDSDGFYIAGHVGLAMRRLAIIAVSTGAQPIANEAGTINIVFNGEIYNFRELRAELERFGHCFATQSDTEVIVHAYEQWGDDALLRLNGMFAFALWDASRERLLLARDRMGQKPLYWHYSEQGLAWGSEAKALLQVPWIERRVNPLALHHYLTLQYAPDPLTMYEGIYRLPAAHQLVYMPGREPEITRWWQLDFEPKWNLPEAELIRQTREILSAAVKRQLVSEVPLGAFLSGGLDSSLTVALMAEQLREPVKTFSIGFAESQYSETRYARQVAERYATDHHEFLFRPADLIRAIEGVLAATDEPLADPAALPLYELARQARQHVTVALCGDGGDETLAGYRRYALDSLLRPYTWLPSWLTQGLIPTMTALLPEPGWLPEDKNPITGLKRLGQFSTVTPKASLVRWGSYFTHVEKLALYTDRWRDELATVDTADWIAAAYDDALAHTLLDCTLHADHVTYLAGDLQPKTDRVTMAHSLEARSPFFDVLWLEWTARLPVKYKVRGMQTKWPLKAAFNDLLPPEISRRGKQGFSVPLGLWFRRELKEWAQMRLFNNQLLETWFRPTAIRALWEEHQSRHVNHGKQLWALVLLGQWIR